MTTTCHPEPVLKNGGQKGIDDNFC